jgi:acetyl-CoA carboxylase biotin carboxyl carrier protein
MAADYKEITKLIKLISESNLTEFKMKDEDVELVIRTDKYVKHKKEVVSTQQPIMQMPPQQMAQPQQPQQATQAPAKKAEEVSAPKAEQKAESEETEDSSNLVEIKSPIVGTFYRSASPDKPPFVKVGDVIEAGDVVCIVEAMKLFNEIESEISGKIVKVLIEDASPVEYDQALFLVDPKG